VLHEGFPYWSLEKHWASPCVLGGNLGGGLFQLGCIYMKFKLQRNFLNPFGDNHKNPDFAQATNSAAILRKYGVA
jgi:hypothetical protein